MKYLIGALTLVLCLACGSKGGQENSVANGPRLFDLMPAATTGLAFKNEVVNSSDFNIFNYRNFYNGGGVAIGDVNNDGLADVFLTANMGPNKLYLNRGNWKFDDVSTTAGIELADKWSTGVAMVDLNADGWLDIYVCNAGFQKGSDQKNSLFINNQDGTFREAATEFGLADEGYTTHVAFFDYDLDGDLDAYILNNSFIPVNTLNYSNNRELYARDWKVRDFLKGGGDKLMRNDNGKFTDVSEAAGIYGSLIGFGLGITVGDVNGDLYPDLYVSNDFFERDYLYINQQDGTFREEVEQRTRHLSLASMGADMADLNNDGAPEIFATEMLPESDYRRKTTVQFEDLNVFELKKQRGFYNQYMHNTLQLNTGNGVFSEIAHFAGVEATDWSWGALLFDADNDGLRDIFVCNGIYHNLTNQDFIDFFANDVVQKMVLTGEKESFDKVLAQMPSEPLANKFFRNNGDLSFTDVTLSWGGDLPSFSNGAAYGDLDNDGDLDLVVNNVNQETFLMQNRSETLANQHLSVLLKGSGTNTFAVGARIDVFQGEEVKSAQVMPTRGFQSSVDYKAIFGLGQGPGADSLRVTWPDRTVSTLLQPAANTLLTIDYASATRRAPADKSAQTELADRPFTPVDLGLIAHREDDYLDLLNEGLVIRSLTNEGPIAASGDLNGDGQDDLFIGGARYQAAQLYFQQDGKLVLQEQSIFRQLSETEDTGIALFDADGDGDLDIFAGSGGNFDGVNSPFLGDKLLFNDGAGNFSMRSNSLPRYAYNTSVAVPLDYDGDGDLDLFVGTRGKPQDYAAQTVSFLYENNGTGSFRDVTREQAPVLASVGMVTDAVWTSLDNGPGTRARALAIVSEWGTPRFFTFNGQKLEEMETNLANYAGWWYVIEAADVDGDGDQDFILGNRGENFYFSADAEHPAKLWVADFDNNGRTEKIMTQHLDGKDMPLAMRRNLTAELPGLKKTILKHEEYAKKSIQDLFTHEALGKARVLEANYFKSAVAINEGNGQFTLRPLPKEVQLSCVCDISCTDVNGDGATDLIMGGNFSGFLPQFSQLDASYGHVLLNDNQGNFALLPNQRSGFTVAGDMKSLTRISIGGRAYLVATVNDAPPQVFRLENAPVQ
ncbi:VCBS repeat-containing protein [Neolewinella lacunae]|uniref:VCBS repeat-containing protein n=1 Tax=Neolewinella lacunae TaxID=1517758 RepID=A0A923TE63_9BACT|nr:VCBS repeat-containing protein [Neolewinella lacunae]MBC6995577.1 VCBS repeat-containing protein [Neolewinella lacunae]MDN3635613.1 VCBS repeat-containing protein [Neolewinella lacunae]